MQKWLEGTRHTDGEDIRPSYGAPGGLDGLPFDNAKADPTATHAPAIRPAFMISDRLCRCFAGAIAAPTGRAAGTPFTVGAFAPAAPEGTAFGACC